MDKDIKQVVTLGRIVVVAGDYPAPNHMRLVFVQQLVDAMVDHGTKITVVAPQSIVHALVHKEALLPRHSVGRSNKGTQYDIFRPYIITVGNRKRLDFILKIWNNWSINRLLRRINPDILYTHFWSSASLVHNFTRRNKIPLFVACGEGDNALEEMSKRLSTNEKNSLKASVNGVISVSSENKRKCIEYNLVSPERVEVFPNGVDINLFKKKDEGGFRAQLGASENDFLIVFVGGFISRKGPERLAQAITLINDPSIKVMFIGKPFPGYPFDFECPGIIFKGPVNHDNLPSYLNAADLFVLPTQKEGCCNAIVEALAVGLPVVSSDGAFNDDILDHQNAIRVNPDDIYAIRDAILKMKESPELMEQMSEESKRRHQSYSIEDRANRILKFMHSNL